MKSAYLSAFMVVLVLGSLQVTLQAGDDKPWCWTKPVKNPEKNPVSPSNGGINWGYCKSSKKNDDGDRIYYRVSVVTANVDGAGSQGQFFIKLFGEEGQTNDLLLTSNGFQKGTSTVKQVVAPNVGDLKRIRLRNTGTDPYRCNTIRVEFGPKFWDFDCSNFIACPKKCSEDMSVAGNQRYEVIVKTSNIIWAETESPVYIEFIGLLGRSPKKLLSEGGFGRGSTEKIEVQSKDVGLVYGIVLSETKSDMWIPQEIIVKRGGQEESKFDPKGQLIKCPLKCSMTLMNPKPKPPGGGGSGGGAGGGGSGGQGGGSGGAGGGSNTDDDGDSDESSLINDYSGAALTPVERSKMIKLSCESIVKNNDDFGPQFSGSDPNYHFAIAICPANCHKDDGAVYGLGLHAEDSSICKSAIVDRSMPFFGGVIGVGVTRGLSNYEKGGKVFGIEIKQFKQAKKSFYTFKIDNVDFAEKDVRILNSEGIPSPSGRVEFRLDGRWGSICSRGMTASAARTICRSLKFQDGTLKNPPSEEDRKGEFCKSFNGEDHCAAEFAPIHYMAMNCEGHETDPFQCYREIATSDQCKHTDDAILECTNQNFDNEQNPKMGTVRLMDSENTPSMSGSGRLEVYMGKWGTVCNTKFNNYAANVACRQMGFDSGKIIGNENQNGVCSDFNGKNFCADSRIEIVMSNVECKGSESQLQSCGNTKGSSSCSHTQDTIVECEGGGGDASGKSQNAQAPASAPPLGKLPMIPIINAECSTKFTLDIFRGDPGSIFLINCPENCVGAQGTIWGAGIYTSDSAICRAAIHGGVIQDYGGLVEVVKMPGMSTYESTTNRYITSTNYGSWPSSFVVAKPNSIAIKLSQAFGNKSSFLQSSMTLKLKSRQGSNNNVPPGICQWLPSDPGFRFDGRTTKVVTSGLTGVEKTSNLKHMSIATKISMDSSPRKLQTIVGHSGCGGWVMQVLENDELVFKQRCSQVEFRSGWRVPLETDVSIVFTFDTSMASFYIDGELYNKQLKNFNFKCDKSLDIGSFSEVDGEIWNGVIHYVEIWDQALNGDACKQLAQNGAKEKPKGLTPSRSYTADDRICISACTTNPCPGTAGAPKPPSGSNPGQGDYGPGQNVVEGIGEGEASGGGGTGGTEQPPEERIPQSVSDQLKCDILGTDKRFNGPTGKQFRVKCPKGCSSALQGNVFGTRTYTDESAICKAGIHSGFSKNDRESVFIVEIANGQDFYESSFANGIQSAAHGHAPRSLYFKEAPPLISIACNTTAMDPRFGGPIGTKFTVQCPADCSKADQVVNGDGIYTDDSCICQAAIHSGLLSDKGGEIAFSIEEGKKIYTGSNKNGIKSQKRQQYIRSFRIVGDKANTCMYFKETYNPSNIFKNWKVVDAPGARAGPSLWEFNTNPTAYALAISQNSKIEGTDFNYGTALVQRNFDCSDGLMLANIYQSVVGPAAIIFRYYDNRNFYAVEVNGPGPYKVRLIKKVEGVGEVVKGVADQLLAKTWYRFKIVYHGDNIQVWLQKDTLRNVELMINVTDSSVQRGTVGLATNGNSNTYFDGIEVREYDKNFGVNDPGASYKRIWDTCLTGAAESHRRKFCKNMYGSYTEGITECMKTHNFCEQCCDGVIPRLENVLNYACWRGCVKEAKAFVVKQNEEKLAQQELLATLSGGWQPKVGDKGDYKPNALGESSYFVTAVVSGYDKEFAQQNGFKKLKLQVKFSANGKEIIEDVIYPNPSLVKCGQALQGRDDCLKN